MSSIIPASSANFASPRDRLQSRLEADIVSGSIASSDKDALSGALDSIDSALQSDRAAQTGSGRPDRSAMKAKIDSLIADQVSSGTLTQDQAKELKQLFARGPGGQGGPGGPGGPQGGQAGATVASLLDGDDDRDGGGTASTDSDPAKMLQDFIKQLQDVLSSSYSSKGSKTADGVSALLVDTQA